MNGWIFKMKKSIKDLASIFYKNIKFTKNDCMAFGDQMNDYELLKKCKI